ncbi:MAG: NAD(P)H-dependent oxidoreductase subunit E [Spirochaetota bacterium]
MSTETQPTEADFTVENLDRIIDAHLDEAGALIPVLQEVQESVGYLPEDALKHISHRLEVPYSEVAGVVSFYSFFSTIPRGRHTVRACLGTACYVRGGKEVLESLKRNLGIEVGGTTEDRMFSLDVGRCFGACGLAPVVVVDETVHQQVKPSRVAELLAPYREEEA